MGSPQFRHASVKGCGVVHAWFPPGSTLEFHTHEHATFAVMLNGSFDLAFRQKTFSCTPGSVAVEPAGEGHANYIGVQGADVLVLQPDGAETEMWRPFAPLFERIGYLRHGGIAGLAGKLVHELRVPDSWSSLAMEGLLLDMLVAAGRVRSETGKAKVPSWLGRVEAMLTEDRIARLDIAALAREAGVHPAYLARAFRRFYHSSVGEYGRRIRLERVAGQLATRGESIAFIANQNGFADQSHLTRSFRRYYGVTPGEFRRRASTIPTRDQHYRLDADDKR